MWWRGGTRLRDGAATPAQFPQEFACHEYYALFRS
jgi:hypothetical protein